MSSQGSGLLDPYEDAGAGAGQATFTAAAQQLTLAGAAQPPPADDGLGDINQRLKQLESAVKAHLAAPRSSGAPGGSSSILAAFPLASPTPPHGGGRAPSAAMAPGRLSERAQLLDSLTDIKAEVSDLAAREVEAQLLKARVTHLEAALSGITAGSFAACGGLASFSGGTATLSGAPARLTRTPSGAQRDFTCACVQRPRVLVLLQPGRRSPCHG